MNVQITIEDPPAFRTLNHAIGGTPLLAVHCLFRGRRRTVYAKSEHLNLTGSIKDRMALHILRRGYLDGLLEPGDRIAEATSGNTGIALAAIGRALGHRVTIFMPDWMSEERQALMRGYGADLVLVAEEEGGFIGALERVEEMASRDPRVFLPGQFHNRANVEAHEMTTGPEIVHQLARRGLEVDAFVAGVGTGGTVMGVGRALRARRPGVRVHPVEPLESPTLSVGRKVGRHRIQGISDDFVPEILRLDELDEVIQVSDGDAILMAQALASRLGLGVGISSGANLVAALLVQERLGGSAVVATVFADDNKKYVSTGLFREEPLREHYVSPAVELIGYEVLERPPIAVEV